MRLIIKLLLCLCLVSATALSQERIRKVMVGTNGDETRIVIAFMEPAQEMYRLQSMIIDMTPVKNRNEQPSSVHVDLTSTDRSLATGEKKQKILLLRWTKAGELELKCDGKWVKHDTGAAIDKIVETTKAVIQSVPVDAKAPTEVTLPQELEQKVSLILNSLYTENIPCLRDVH